MFCAIIVRAYRHVVIVAATFLTLSFCKYDAGKVLHISFPHFHFNHYDYEYVVLCDGTYVCSMPTLSTAYVLLLWKLIEFNISLHIVVVVNLHWH